MSDQALDAKAFQPLHHTHEVQNISRPSLSYWQDAWIRLKANGRAINSLYLIIGLLVFTIVGPWIWQVDPAVQDADQISQPPGADRRVTLVPDYTPWYGDTGGSGEGLRFVASPTTQFIRLQWDTLPGAAGYRVYRNIFPIGPEKAFGLPLKETPLTVRWFKIVWTCARLLTITPSWPWTNRA